MTTIVMNYISMAMNYFRKLKTKSPMNYLANEDGLVAIEYGLIAALVAVAIIVTVTALGDELNSIFTYITAQLEGAQPAAPPAAP